MTRDEVIQAIRENNGRAVKVQTGTRTYGKYIDTCATIYWIQDKYLWRSDVTTNQFGGVSRGLSNTWGPVTS